jgi:hypothetical protein
MSEMLTDESPSNWSRRMEIKVIGNLSTRFSFHLIKLRVVKTGSDRMVAPEMCMRAYDCCTT